MTTGKRTTNLIGRALGIILLIPGLLQVPLPQADFHIIRHHHGAGEVCPQHDHLLRWHPQAADGQDVAVLHWHWLLPKSLDPSRVDNTPSLHAHDVDPVQPEMAAGRLLVREDRGRDARLDLTATLGLLDSSLVWSPLVPPPNLQAVRRLTAPRDGAPLAPLACFVRWNC